VLRTRKDAKVIVPLVVLVLLATFTYLVLPLKFSTGPTGLVPSGESGTQGFAASDVVTSCGVVVNTSTSLAQNLTGDDTCITLNASNMFFNCSGFAINYNANGGDSEFGILAVGLTNLTVRDCIIRDINSSALSGIGINFTNVNSSNITNNNITTRGNGSNIGIRLLSSSQNHLYGNNITTNGSGLGNKGIVLGSVSENNNIIANDIATNGSERNSGIEADGLSNNITYNNIRSSSADFANFNFGIGVQYGANYDVSYNRIETSGTGDFANGINVTHLNNSRFINNTIRATGSDTLRGIFVQQHSNNNLFHNNTIFMSAFFGTPGYGIEFNRNASNNSVMGNNITTNGTSSNFGVYVFLSDRTTIAYNTIRTVSGNTGHGIDLDGNSPSEFSDYAFIISNNITAGHGGGSNIGVEVEEARHVIIENNTIFANSSSGCCNAGMDTTSFSFRVNATGNSFTADGPSNGNLGIDYSSTSNSTIQHNTVVTKGTSNSDGFTATGDNLTVVNNTITILATSSRGIAIGQTVGAVPRNRTHFFINNRINVNTTSSIGISILGARDTERHTFNNTVLNVTGTWIQAEGGTATRVAGNFSLNFTNTTFLSENGSIRIPGSFILNFSQLRINHTNLNITRNRAFMNATNTSFLNTSAQVNMNQSAVITLTSITSIDPLPRVDFEDDGTFVDCLPPQCTEISFADGAFVYNVTSFTTYSSTEGALNVSLTKLDTPDPVNASALLNYTIIINVTGANNASNITLTDQYPPQVIFINSSPANASGNNTFIIGNRSAGSSFSVNITVLVNNGTGNFTINNTANISYQNVTGNVLFLNVTENTTVIGAAPAPPSPTPSAGGGGGWTTPTVGGVNPWDEPEFELPGCIESWTCGFWGPCEYGRQRRVCTLRQACNATHFVPLMERECAGASPVSQPVAPDIEQPLLPEQEVRETQQRPYLPEPAPEPSAAALPELSPEFQPAPEEGSTGLTAIFVLAGIALVGIAALLLFVAWHHRKTQ